MLRCNSAAGRSTKCLLALVFVLLVGGCGGGPKQYAISGSVSYQGKPVTEGQIVFADAAGNGPTATAAIENGEYEITTTAGEKKVRITATRETGKMIEGAMGASYPERVDLIPPQYNTATTLLRKVGPGEERVLDFTLE